LANALSAGPDFRVSNATILGECTFAPQRADTNPLAIALEQKAVSCPDTEDPAYFTGHGDLPFAGDFGLFLLHDTPYFITFSLLIQRPASVFLQVRADSGSSLV
jgi:hypothetical protein